MRPESKSRNMKQSNPVIPLIPFLVLLLFGTKGFSQTINIDTNKAKIEFLVVSEDINGSIGDFKADIKISDTDPGNSHMNGSVGLETIKTGNFLRDGHLMWKKYFHKRAFPRMSFKSSRISRTDSGYTVKGKLTIKETTKEITISFSKQGTSLIGKTSINTSDFGINVFKKRERNNVMVSFMFPIAE